MLSVNKTSMLYPDYIAPNVTSIDAATLRSEGITHIVFDIDRTLVPHGKDILTEEYIRCIAALESAGFTILIGSNRRRDITALANSIGAEVVQAHRLSMKPFKSFYLRVVDKTRTTPDHIAMVGDHVVNDVIGGNRAGFATILVDDMLHRYTYPFYGIYRYFILKNTP